MRIPAAPADAPTTVRRGRVLWLRKEAERQHDADFLTREEPLEIRVGTLPIAVLMRTPGHDLDLVTGFVLTEGIFKSWKEIDRIVPCEQSDDPSFTDSNVMRVIPQAEVDLDAQLLSRNFYSTSSCGICGKRSIEMAMKVAPRLTEEPTLPGPPSCRSSSQTSRPAA